MTDLVVGGRRSAIEAVRAGAAREILVDRDSRRTPPLDELLAAATDAGVPIRRDERAVLDGLASDHHGVVTRVRLAPALGERDLAVRSYPDDAVVVVLDGIEDPQNLGAAARSAEAAAVDVLVLRERRAAGVTAAAIRASAGALLHLRTARVANVGRALGRLRDAGFTAVGLDEEAPADIYADPCPPGRVAVVLGSEGSGLSRLTREACDVLVRLPMRGRVGSLNASASLAAALFAYVLPRRPRGSPARGA